MTYDEMILRGPDERHEIGTQDGETCGRYPEPDEDAPRGYKPKPCNGTMVDYGFLSEMICCDTCGELA